MEDIIMSDESKQLIPFNSPLETGMRSVVILNASYPRAYDLFQLTWLDHIIVHSADVGGPPSIHPDIPQRSGEILTRRKLVENGLNLMRKFHMVEVEVLDKGFYYKASDEADPFVGLLSTQYISLLKERAEWLVNDIGKLSHNKMRDLIVDKLGKWNIEFDGTGYVRD